MPGAHRNGDLRLCDAHTVVSHQTTVYANDELWAVHGDECDHGSGALLATFTGVFINDIPVIVHTPDEAIPDALIIFLHSTPFTAQGSGDVIAY